MNENIFEIRDLSCSYNDKDDVLRVKSLDIPKGKLIVLLGVSGAGKSTFLETLGLMNRTFRGESKMAFMPKENAVYNFEDLWKEKDQNIYSYIRNKYFSFIFQDTNLMPNFTAYENICITQMIQGKSKSEAIEKVKEVMRTVGLEEIDEEKKAFELSGGQRQRIAFVRAITPEFSVLFGDEPTGNLDSKNSRELMTILKDNIRAKHRSAIIVSHNIDLALEFADQIIVLTKNSNNVGEILDENIFVSTDSHESKTWKNLPGDDISDIFIKLHDLLKN